MGSLGRSALVLTVLAFTAAAGIGPGWGAAVASPASHPTATLPHLRPAGSVDLLTASSSLSRGAGPAGGRSVQCMGSGGAELRCAQGPAPTSRSADWTNLTTGVPPTSGAGGWAMTFDSTDGYVLLYTGWATWDYNDGLWTNLTPSLASSPSQRNLPGLADDPADGYVLMWGGGAGQAAGCSGPAGVCNDTWTFAGGTWTKLVPACRASSGAAESCNQLVGERAPLLAYDPAVHQVLLVGTPTPAGPGTWMYSNGTWTNWNTNTLGVAQGTPVVGAVAYDGSDQAVVGFGTPGGSAFTRGNQSEASTWKWTNDTWTNLTSLLTTSPPARYDPGLVWDSEDGYVLLSGGWTLTCQTWASGAPGAYCTNATVSIDSDSWMFFHDSWTSLAPVHSPDGVAGGSLIDDTAEHSVLRLLGSGFGCTASPCYSLTPPRDWSYDVWAWGTSPPIAGLSIGASDRSPEAGHPVNFSATFLGGTPPVAFTWQFGDGSSASTQNVTHTYASAGVFQVRFYVNDSAAHRVSATLTVTVQGNLSAGISDYPNPADQGLPVAFTSNVGGGTPPYSYSWTFGDGGRSTLPDPTHSFGLVGFYGVKAWINDSTGASQYSTVTVKVDPALVVISLNATPNPAVLGAPVSFHANVSGGTPPYALSWAFGDGGIGGNLANITHIFTTNGPFVTTISAVDASGGVASGSINITIALNASVLANASLGASPLPVAFVSDVVGGTPSYIYAWQFGDGATSVTANPAHTYASAGGYSASLIVHDAKGRSVTTLAVVEVTSGGGPLTLSLTPSAGQVALGGTVVITAAPSGGVGKYDLSWSSLPAGCSVRSLTSVSCAPTVTGTASISASLADAAGHATTASTQITVGSSPTPPGRPPVGASLWTTPAVLGGVVIGLAVAVAVGFLAGRRSGPAPGGPAPSSDRYAPYRDPGGPNARVNGRPPSSGTDDRLDDLF